MRLAESSLGENGVDEATVYHIRMVTSLIEGRNVGLAEIYDMLCKILRQHPIDKGKKIPYFDCGYHNKGP